MTRMVAFRRAILLTLEVVFSGVLLAQPKIVAVVNSASWQSGLPGPGALATAFVSGLTGLTPGTYAAPSSHALPHSLAGLYVELNGDYAPLLAVIVPTDPADNVQINFQVPLSAMTSLCPFSNSVPGACDPNGYLVIGGAGQNPLAWQSPLEAFEPFGAFFAQAKRIAVAVHASDFSPVTLQNPAHPGEAIVAYADDFFMTWPPPPIATPVPPQPVFQVNYQWVRQLGNLFLQTYPTPVIPCISARTPCIGSITNTPALKIDSMSLAPGSVGVEQIKFEVPSNQKPGAWALFFNVGSCPDGSGIPGTCGGQGGVSSPYVLLPVD